MAERFKPEPFEKDTNISDNFYIFISFRYKLIYILQFIILKYAILACFVDEDTCIFQKFLENREFLLLIDELMWWIIACQENKAMIKSSSQTGIVLQKTKLVRQHSTFDSACSSAQIYFPFQSEYHVTSVLKFLRC